MKRERVIEGLKKEVRCHSDEQYEECQKYPYCHNCPCTYPEQLIDVIKAALELLEGEDKESCRSCKFAKNPKAQDPCVRCSHSFYNFFRPKEQKSCKR